MLDLLEYIADTIGVIFDMVVSVWNSLMTAFNIILESLGLTIAISTEFLPSFLGTAIIVYLSLFLVKFTVGR